MKARAVRILLAAYERASRGGFFDRPVPRRAFEGAYLAYKVFEAGPVSHLRTVVTPGSVVVDVGANIGFFALRFGRWVGPAGRVIAVEPEARNVDTLRRRIGSAGLADVVECVPAVAADRAGLLHLAVNPAHPGDHHLAADGEAVIAVTVDDLLESERRPISLLKIDVQGAEQLVLAGARRVLADQRPAIFLEIDNEALARQGASADALVDTLLDHGYDGHVLTRRGVGPSLDRAAILDAGARGYVDVLFHPRAT